MQSNCEQHFNVTNQISNEKLRNAKLIFWHFNIDHQSKGPES